MLTRRAFLSQCMATTLGAQALISYAARAQSTQKPNILFLFADDMRFNAINALGTPEIVTPNLDKLVARGTALTHCHIMGGTSPAVCMPSRAMLMTGRSLFHLQEEGALIPPTDQTFPELFRSAGYQTFITGKWHADRATLSRGFTDGDAIMFGGMSDHLKTPVYDFDPEGLYPKGTAQPADGFSSTVFSDAAIQFINQRDAARPFMAYVSYTAPHDPRMAPDTFKNLYTPDTLPLPPNFTGEHAFDNGELRVRDELLAPFPRTPEVVREHIAEYYAMISHLDMEIGRVLDALDASGLADNTIIVFAADNGLAVGQHGLMGKQSLYDHSVRVPMIFAGPGIPAGRRSDALCYLYDLFPTLCELTATPGPSTIESQSLAPILQGKATTSRDAIFAAYRDFQRLIRLGDWKLIRYNANGQQRTQLFDLKNDPWELKNLAGNPEQATRMDELNALLRKTMRALDDPRNLDREDWGLPIPQEST